MSTVRSPIAPAMLAVLVWLAAVAGCHAARVLAPPPSLRAASASDFAIDLEFAETLDRASAQNASNYLVNPAGNPGASVAIYSATLIDTTFGRVVQLLFAGGPLPDTTEFEVRANGVRTVNGAEIGPRRVSVRTGLSYRTPVRQLFVAHCDRCHGPANPGGSYRTDSYSALQGTGRDATPNLIAGDPSCLVLRRTRPLRTMFDQGDLTYLDYEILLNWVVSYGARP